MKAYLLTILSLLAVSASAENTDIKMKDIKTDGDTSITIKKGVQDICVEYEVVEGKEDVFGAPHFDKSKAYQGWQSACKEWKDSMRELNKENKVLALHCQAPTVAKDGDQYTYSGPASYRLRVRIRDKK